jgi:hypothetical protein
MNAPTLYSGDPVRDADAHYHRNDGRAANMARSAKVQFWDDERDIGNSLIVTLANGWRFAEDGEHVRGFDTVREARSEVAAAKRCKCVQCAADKVPA